MPRKRRSFLITVGAGSTILLAGCSSDSEDDEVQDSDGDGVIDSQDYAPNDPDVQDESDVSQSTPTQDTPDTQDTQIADSSSPEPEVIATSFAEPQAVSTDSTAVSGSRYDFSATVENTGEAGDVIITLQWINDEGLVIEDVSSIERYYRAGERRAETITAELPDNIPRYGFNLLASSVTATVKNNGGSGAVDVEVYSPLADSFIVHSSTRVEMTAGETQDVEIELDSESSLINEDTEIRAVSAE